MEPQYNEIWEFACSDCPEEDHIVRIRSCVKGRVGYCLLEKPDDWLSLELDSFLRYYAKSEK